MTRTQPGREAGRWWRVAFALGLTGLIVSLLVRSVGGPLQLVKVFTGVAGGEILVSVALSGFALALAALRWRVVLQTLDRRVSYGRCLYAILATWPIAAITPSRLADLLRAVAVRDAVPLEEGVGSVLTEKVFDLHSLCLLVLVGGILVGQVRAVAAAALLLVAFWIGFFTGPALVRRWVQRFQTTPRLERATALLHAVEGLQRSPRAIITLTILSVSAWLLSTLIIGVLLRATDADLPWSAVLLVWPIAVLAGVLPVTISGLGTRDGTFVFLVRDAVSAPIDTAPILAATLLYPVVTIWIFALIGLPFLAHLVRHDPAARSSARRLALRNRQWASANDALVDEQPVEHS